MTIRFSFSDGPGWDLFVPFMTADGEAAVIDGGIIGAGRDGAVNWGGAITAGGAADGLSGPYNFSRRVSTAKDFSI